MAASTASLPSYQFEPRAAEQRLAHRDRFRPAGDFVKNSKSGEVVLRLSGQSDSASLPSYGRGAAIDGIVELTRTDNVQNVEVKVSHETGTAIWLGADATVTVGGHPENPGNR